MNWNLIADGLPEEKQDVLLRWAVPDAPSIFRIGRVLFKPWDCENPIWRFELDCGDASAMIFSQRDDEQPTHWAVLEEPEMIDGGD